MSSFNWNDWIFLIRQIKDRRHRQLQQQMRFPVPSRRRSTNNIIIDISFLLKLCFFFYYVYTSCFPRAAAATAVWHIAFYLYILFFIYNIMYSRSQSISILYYIYIMRLIIYNRSVLTRFSLLRCIYVIIYICISDPILVHFANI